MRIFNRLLLVIGAAAFSVGTVGTGLASAGQGYEHAPDPVVTVVADACATVTVTGLPVAEVEDNPQWESNSYGSTFTLTIQPGDIVIEADGTFALAPGTYTWEFTKDRRHRDDEVLQSGFFTVTACPPPVVEPPVVIVNPPDNINNVTVLPAPVIVVEAAVPATAVNRQPTTTG